MNTSARVDVHIRVSELACDAESISYTNIHLYPAVYVQAAVERREERELPSSPSDTFELHQWTIAQVDRWHSQII